MPGSSAQGIKSIQRGVTNLATGNGTQAVTAVNTAKTVLNFLGCSGAAGAYGSASLTNSTTISFAYVTGANAPGTISYSWELIEYF